MTNYSASFFDGKREWSEVKDQVLAHYIEAYLKKVKMLNKPILLIDAFAGQGKFGDGKPGSPLLMLEKAEKYVPNNYFAIFVNKEKEDHRQLEKNIAPYIKNNRALAIHSDAQEMLKVIQRVIKNHTLFLYLDPFGLTGCDFKIIEPLLSRVSHGYSTELLINISMPALHREGARNVVIEKGLEKLPPQTKMKIKNVDLVMGGNYWRSIEWDRLLSKEEREHNIIKKYQEKLRKYMSYVMSCPVRENEKTHVKYYITFCSRHPDAMVLMNDTMGNAYNKYMHEKSKESLPLFAGDSSDEFYEWERERNKAGKYLYTLVQEYVKKFKPRLRRKKLWEKIVMDHFMQFLEKEYRQVVKKLVEEKKLIAMKPNERLNDDSVIYFPDDPRP